MHQVPDSGAAERLRDREVRRLVVSVGISALGTWSYNVGIAVYAYQETGSSAWVAAATVGRYIPALLITAVGSRVADRLPRRRVAVSSDVFCAVVMALLTVVAAAHGPLVLAIGLAALSSGVSRIQSSAALASAADIVPESRLSRTATLLSTTDSVATAVGPALASLVLAVASPAFLFALNGISFAVSAVLLAGLTLLRGGAPTSATRADTDRHDADHRAAVRLVWPLLAVRTLTAVVYGSDVVLLAVIATSQLRQGTGGYGWLLAAAGAGGLLGAWWLRSRGGSSGTVRRSVLGAALYCLPLLVFLASPLLPAALSVQAVRGAGCVVVSATVLAALQRAVPATVSARVFGTSHVLVMVGTSVGAVVAPVLVGAWGLGTAVAVVALVPLAGVLALAPALVAFDRRSAAATRALDPRVDVLRGLALFRDASRSTLYAVADGATEISVPAGTAVVAEGDPSDALYVLLEGSVDVSAAGPSGPRHLRTMGPGSYFGEIGLLHGVARTATVVSTVPCRLWRVPADTFLAAVTQAGVSGALTEGVRVRLDTSALAGA